MKNFAKRSISLILALFMCLSLVPILSPNTSAATVDYTYDGSYVYNWGQREETCTFLSPMAEAFYADNGVTYADLAALAGASSTSAVPSSDMYLELQELMASNHSYKNGYDANKTLCKYTDCQNGGGSISSFYSGNSVGPTWDGTWNREHTWPNSKGLGGSDENDIMMIRPTSYAENGSRGNTAYGEGSSYYDPNDESDGAHNLHGDVARIWLYVYVRWGNTTYAWGTSGVMESKEVLLKWMEEDPVDTWEMGRNDAVEAITGTRNVFVDYPELCFLMFDEDVPADYTTPSGEGNTASYTVTAVSNNTSYGTVSCTGRTITAVPAEGYYAQGYTVTSGTATVTQSGNTFSVQASSDCTVRIDFAAKTTARIVYLEDGVQAQSVSSYQGDSITLATHSGTVPDGYTFVGWVSGAVADTEVEPTAIYSAGSSYTVTNPTTVFYALYSYREEGSGSGSTEYVLTDISQISSTDEVVITMEYTDGTVYALPNNSGTSSAPAGTTISASNGVLTETPADTLLWNIETTDSGYTFCVAGGSDTLYCTNANNGVRIGSSTANVFVIDSATGYLKNTSVSRYLGVYRTNPDWRCYTSTSVNIGSQTLGFYVKGVGATVYYTTSISEEEIFAVYEAEEKLAGYADFSTLLDSYDPSTQHIKLLKDAEVTATANTDLYIDMNGYSLSGILETNGCKVYGMDSSTDEYTEENMGYFSCVDSTNAAIVPEAMVKTSITGSARNYLTIATDDGYTFHRFYLGITYASVKASAKGVGYKALICGDAMVMDEIDTFGYSMQLSGHEAVTVSKAGSELTSGEHVTLRVDNYNADKYGETGLTAKVYITVGDQTIESTAVTMTLRQMMEKINDLTLTDEQKTALAAWIAESETMQTWDVGNIYTAE